MMETDPTDINQKKAKVTVLISHKVDFRTWKLLWEKAQSTKKTAVLSIYALNNLESIYVKQKTDRLKGEIDKSTVILGDFKTLLSTIDRTAR